MFPVLTSDQLEFKRAIHDFAAGISPSAEVRRLAESDTGYDEQIWSRMASELGLQSMTVPEVYGGAGFGPVESAIVFEEFGRRLVCAPLFSTVALAVNALLASGDDDACAELLPGIANGTTKATVAVYEHDGRFAPGGVHTRADGADDAITLTGEKLFVIDGMIADILIVAAREPSGVSLFAVEPASAGVQATPMKTLDLTRKQARISLENASARRIGEAGRGWTTVEHMRDLAVVALAAEQVGSMEAVLQMTVEYAKSRVQFGRPIGSFQAVKHKCANMLVTLESARSAAGYSAWAAAFSPDELPSAAALAKAYCSDAFLSAAKDTIQLHGGIGFTWEHDAHLFLRRAKSSQLLFGSPAEHRDELARLINLDTAVAA